MNRILNIIFILCALSLLCYGSHTKQDKIRVRWNLAIMAVASSPDNLSDDHNSKGDQAAIDGDYDTYWDEEDDQKGYRLRLTFPKPQDIDRITLVGHSHHSFAPKAIRLVADEKNEVTACKEMVYKNNFFEAQFKTVQATVFDLFIDEYYHRSPCIRELGLYSPNVEDVPKERVESWKKEPNITLKSGIHHLIVERSSLDESIYVTARQVEAPIFNKGAVWVIPETHCDQAWVSTPEKCQEIGSKIILQALDLIKKYPEYRFSMECLVFLRGFARRHPARIEELLARMKEGKFAWGATYNMPYEGLSLGEGLVREYYLGRKWLKQTYCLDTSTVWNNDTPGHTFQHPQIMKKAGVEQIIISGFRPREGGQQLPRVLFYYGSPDGSRVLAYAIPEDYFGWQQMRGGYKDMLAKLPKWIETYHKVFVKEKNPPHIAFSDGGDLLSPDERVIKGVNEWNQKGNSPKIQFGTGPEFLETIKKHLKDTPTLTGEIPNPWAYIHAPCHVEAGIAGKEAEIALFEAELYAALAHIKTKKPWPAKELERLWEQRVFALDHNWGGNKGKETDRIYLDGLIEARDQARAIRNEAALHLSIMLGKQTSNRILVFNSSAWTRSGIVKIAKSDVPEAKDAKGAIVDSEGQVAPTLVSKDQIEFQVISVPAFGYKEYMWNKEASANKVSNPPKADQEGLESERLKIKVGQGGLLSVEDKLLKKELIDVNERLWGELLLYQNYADDVRPHDANRKLLERSSKQLIKDKSWENKPGRASYQWTVEGKEYTAKCTLSILSSRPEDLFYRIELVWGGTIQRELRAAFPARLDKPYKRYYDVPFGVVEIGKEFECKFKEFREVGSFYHVEDAGRGWTLGTTATVYHLEQQELQVPTAEAVLLATLVSCGDKNYRYDQKGTHVFDFVLRAGQDRYSTSRAGEELLKPLWGAVVPAVQKPSSASDSFFKISEEIRLSAIKLSDDGKGLIFRLFDTEGQHRKVSIQFSEEVKKAFLTRITEEDPTPIDAKGKHIDLKMTPYSIDTFMFHFFE